VVEEGLEHATGYANNALVLAHPDAELDRRNVDVP
jgi:hypothetical protein